MQHVYDMTIAARLSVSVCIDQKPHHNFHCSHSQYEPPHDKTNKITVRPANTQISLGIRQIWSESSLCTQWVSKDASFLHVDSEDSDQTGRMPRLICVFAGHTCHFVGFVMRWLIYEDRRLLNGLKHTVHYRTMARLLLLILGCILVCVHGQEPVSTYSLTNNFLKQTETP